VFSSFLGLKIQLSVPFIPQIEDVGSEVVYGGEGGGGGWKRKYISNFSEIMVMSRMDLQGHDHFGVRVELEKLGDVGRCDIAGEVGMDVVEEIGPFHKRGC